MTYELAKELQDAGCPVSELGDYNFDNFSEFDKRTRQIHLDLSELIEACGIGFEEFALIRSMKITENYGTPYWYAIYETKSREEKGSGKTPEEAVAKLWLTLNKTT